MTDLKRDTLKTIRTQNGTYQIHSLPALEKLGLGSLARLPFSIRIVLESVIRNLDGFSITQHDVDAILKDTGTTAPSEIAFKPGRVVLQDFTGVPAVVDLAAMRSGLKRLGGDYRKINPLVPCDLVVDHSVQVDAFGSPDALGINTRKEFERNRERYEFLKWAEGAFKNFRVVPPATGIVHQVNLEYLAQGVLVDKQGTRRMAYPDSLVGTDSHTTMINGLGVLGWGVGGIEAEAVMLGEPIFMLKPEVVGFELTGKLARGVTATDLVLTVTESLRKEGVVGKFVEYFGNGLQELSLPDRATLANMAPEYGATMGFFPVDEEVLRYYRLTGRDEDQVDLIERYFKEQDLFYKPQAPPPHYNSTVRLDMSTVEPCLAGPKRPQDRVALNRMKESFREALRAPVAKRGFELSEDELKMTSKPEGHEDVLIQGSVVIAAITSCTNTSNPGVMLAAGLLAKKAVEKGLCVKPSVKTSLAPGSTVVTEYLRQAGLEPYLEKLGFHTVGYGCTTCIGNSGPLPEAIVKAVGAKNLVAASVLSGNRNFEGRINPHVRANYLASPPLVVAFAIAGRIDLDLDREPLGTGTNGESVFLKDIWPTAQEIKDCARKAVTRQAFQIRYRNVLKGNDTWNAISSPPGDLYEWNPKSTYIQEPPFFDSMKKTPDAVPEIKGARVLVMLGDSVTTDHISPAGSFAPQSPAGQYLQSLGVLPQDFNSYGSRRGNDRVMVRGTFANIRLRNLLTPGQEGSSTIYFGDGTLTDIFDASVKYRKDKTPLVVLAGKEYGSGSSRDWAAKGTALLGVRVVLAQSYERIHRSNLIGMGVLPLEFMGSDSVKSLGLSGDEVYDFDGIRPDMKPRCEIRISARTPKGAVKEFKARSRIDTPIEVEYYQHGGILPRVIRKLA